MESLVYIKRQFISADLKKSTEKIKRCGDNIRKNYIKIARELAIIDDTESYLDDGFESAIDYAGQIFSISKSTAYVLITIGREWINEDGERTALTTEGADYSVSQIGVLLPLGVDKARELHDSEDISPAMSVRQIKAVVKDLQDTPEETPEETPEAASEENGADVVDSDADVSEMVVSINIYDDGGLQVSGHISEEFYDELYELITRYLEVIR